MKIIDKVVQKFNENIAPSWLTFKSVVNDYLRNEKTDSYVKIYHKK